MAASVASNGEILQINEYPPSIRGSLRLILQLKDAFLSCFNLVEEYRSQLLACQRGFARDIVVYQLSQGLASILRLREDLVVIESKGYTRVTRNSALRKFLVDRYSMQASDGSDLGAPGLISRLGHNEAEAAGGTGTAVITPGLPPPVSAPDSVEAALHGGLDHFVTEINVDVVQVPNEIDLATCTTEAGTHLLPVVEFYRGFFFLQMHFQLIMCQAANFAMPVVTCPMGLAERAFAWPSLPSFGLSANSGSMRDRLLEINTEVHQLAQRLHACLALVREKLKQDKRIESYYFQHTAAQEALRRNLLRCLQAQRVYLDCLETQNDRLAGLAIKLDPGFSKTTEFTLMTGTGVGKLVGKNWNQNSNLVGSINTSDNESDAYYRGGDREAMLGNHDSHSHDGYRNQSIGGRHSDRRQPGPVNEGYSSSGDSSEMYQDILAKKTNMNASASGKTQQAISTLQSESRKQYTNRMVPMNLDADPKVKSLIRGSAKALDELLIGFDSVAASGPKLEHLSSPSFLNSEHYVISISDDAVDAMGNPLRPSRGDHLSGRPAPRVHAEYVEPKSPSLRYTQAETISSTSSVTPIQPTVVQSKQFSTLGQSDFSHSAGGPSEYTDNTLDGHSAAEDQGGDQNRPLDTNVNASGVRFPTLVSPPNCQPQPQRRMQRSASSSAAQFRTAMVVNPPVASANAHGERIVDYTRRLPPAPPGHAIKSKLAMTSGGIFPTFEDIQHENQMLRMAVEGHVQPVASVGTAECGAFCAPDWTNREGGKKRLGGDDLLNEPKRSAVNKALVAHRSRLVETILQADEEKLEELITLLTKE